ncbi:MAG: DNA integrity scanning protein DisA, partial [Actinobacteria bacterium]|nr:DNA integrity scanning protein DisA [Actinomycetota bacterium]
EVEGSAAILSRANQALATMERYKDRLDEVAGVLSELEIEDMVTVRDVVVVAQRIEMVRRIGAEIADYVIELGSDGRLLSLQHAELVGGVADELVLIARDCVPNPSLVDSALAELETLSASELLNLERIATAFGLGTESGALDSGLTPRGYRLLSRVPRLPDFAAERLVDYFGDAQGLLSATAEQLQAVDGIGETRALATREGLARIVDSTFR